MKIDENCKRGAERMSVLPILFNTEMVKAILEGRKTVTRRAAFRDNDLCAFPRPNNLFAWRYRGREYRSFNDALIDCKSKCKYRKGDILYVRETWRIGAWNYDEKAIAVDYADGTCRLEWIPISDKQALIKYIKQSIDDAIRAGLPELHWKAGQAPTRWRPSIHMPKEAARIFLRVTSVSLEQLREPFFSLDCPIVELRNEGIDIGDQCRECLETYGAPCCIDQESECGVLDDVRCEFSDLWDSTINPADFEDFSWAANPWVWVISFERCEKPENWP